MREYMKQILTFYFWCACKNLEDSKVDIGAASQPARVKKCKDDLASSAVTHDVKLVVVCQ